MADLACRDGVAGISRRVIGWKMNEALTAYQSPDALFMAIWRGGKPDALLHQSGPSRHILTSSSTG